MIPEGFKELEDGEPIKEGDMGKYTYGKETFVVQKGWTGKIYRRGKDILFIRKCEEEEW